MPLIVDNTAAPLIARPFDHGAAVVVYSATKYIGGHGTSIGGLIVDGGNFPWEKHAERFPLLTKPDAGLSRRDLDRSRQAAGPDRLSSCARASSCCATLARRFRPSMPSSSSRASRRCRCACASTTRMRSRWPNFLNQPGCRAASSSPACRAARAAGARDAVSERRLRRAGRLRARRAGVEAGRAFIDSLKLLYHVANIGDARSLAIHPASTTHQQLTPGRATRGRRDARLRAPLRRPRTSRRHHRRHGAGARQGRLRRSAQPARTGPL